MTKPNMAMIGMGVMGSNLAQNFAEKGIHIALFNRTTAKTARIYESVKDQKYADKLHPVTGGFKELVDLVGEQGIYFFIVKAGRATRAMIDQLVPHLEKGAIIVDLANSFFPDTEKNQKDMEKKGIHFFGIGVSGGEEGARYGPSMMAGGGTIEVYNEKLRTALEKVAAKAPQDGKPCVAYHGKGGAGHFVKMVHNGIEYGDMQLIAESYDFMKSSLGMSALEIADVFEKWNKGLLESFLIEISVEVLRQKDLSGKGQLIDFTLDKAKMKGTGTWTIESSLNLEEGVVPIPSIYAAVESRAISFTKEKRVSLSKEFFFPISKYEGDKTQIINDLEKALYIAKISSYAQGIDLIRAGDKEHGFGNIDIANIAEIWRAGCIIRAKFLGDITKSYQENSNLLSLIQAPVFKDFIQKEMPAYNWVCQTAAKSNVPFMAFDASRNYILQLVSKRLSANMIQGLRDFFGAHTYERTDKDGVFHTNWSGDRKEVQE